MRLSEETQLTPPSPAPPRRGLRLPTPNPLIAGGEVGEAAVEALRSQLAEMGIGQGAGGGGVAGVASQE